jgi:type VI protein secretion system component VasF
MSLYLRQQNTRSDLQDKLAKELQERAKQKAAEAERPDGVDDSRYIEGTKKTTSLAWVWALIGLAIVALVIWLLISTAK